MNKPQLALARPTSAAAAASRVAVKMAGEGTVRLVLEVPPSARQALKVRAAERGTTIKAYLLALAAADGVSIGG
jgi:hypothetical protein